MSDDGFPDFCAWLDLYYELDSWLVYPGPGRWDETSPNHAENAAPVHWPAWTDSYQWVPTDVDECLPEPCMSGKGKSNGD